MATMRTQYSALRHVAASLAGSATYTASHASPADAVSEATSTHAPAADVRYCTTLSREPVLDVRSDSDRVAGA
jgi:hypothetical protein